MFKSGRFISSTKVNLLLLVLLVAVLLLSSVALQINMEIRTQASRQNEQRGFLQPSTSNLCRGYQLVDQSGKSLLDCILDSRVDLAPYSGKEILLKGSYFQSGSQKYFLATSVETLSRLYRSRYSTGRQPVGPFEVGTAGDSFSLSPWGRFNLITYYPALTSGSLTQPNLSGSPYPLVIFSPGFMANKEMYHWLGQGLASQGYLVIVYTPPQMFNIDLKQRADGFKAAIDFILAKNQTEGNLFKGLVNPDKIGIAGHSYGAMANLIVLSQDSRIKTAVSLAAGCQWGSGVLAQWANKVVYDNIIASCKKITVPIQIQVGNKDTVTPPESAHLCYENISSPKEYLEIKGATHNFFVDEPFASAGQFMEKKGDISAGEQQQISLRYLVAWFDYYLKAKSESREIIFGAKVREDLSKGVLTKVESTEITVPVVTPVAVSPTPVQGTKVAVLNVWEDPDTVEKLKKIVTKAGFSAEVLSSFEIERGALAKGYKILLVPGGFSPFLIGLNKNFSQQVREFVSNGGGYVGICAGSVIGAKSMREITVLQTPVEMIGLVDVEAIASSANIKYTAFVKDSTPLISLTNHPVNHPMGNQTIRISYKGGPALKEIAGSTQKKEIIGRYAETPDPQLPYLGMGAAVAAEYGQGKAVLFAVHPEYTSTYLRDNDTSFMIVNALKWVSP